MNIEYFTRSQTPSWMTQRGDDTDIVMTTRIRLARNLAGFRFPLSFSQEEVQTIQKKVQEAFSTDVFQQEYSYFLMSDLSQLTRQILVEKHLISPYLAKRMKTGAVFLSADESVSVMVNEEDHLRIQCLAPGLQLAETFQQANDMDDLLCERLGFSFDEQFGYLTSCPTNVGTGLRSSVMLHLPALAMLKRMNGLVQKMTRLGIVVRGIYGEGSEHLGNIYQISNQITLGKSEQEILRELQAVVAHIIDLERQARKHWLDQARFTLTDRVHRALGTLLHARILTSEEAAICLSNVRLGVDLKLINDVSEKILNECVLFIQPGFVQQYAEKPLEAGERDVFRAKYVREKLHESLDNCKGDGNL